MELPLHQEIAAMTPMMRQYYELKQQCGEAILFFRMGDFYEIFGSDALEVSPKLEITLTSRERGDQQKISFCGVPHHSAQGYWLKLLKLGYKVAIADQVEDPAQAKGLVKREITRTLSPGCIDELEGLEGDSPNYLLAAYENPLAKQWAIVLADLSTGELRLGQVNTLAEVVATIENFSPREVLLRRFCVDELKAKLSAFLSRTTLSFSYLPEGILRDSEEQLQVLAEIFGPALGNQPLIQTIDGASALLAGLMSHYRLLKASLKQFLKILPLYDPETISLGETVVRDLELFETARSRTNEGSLFKIINHCQSPMGARALRQSLAYPLGRKDLISDRHEVVARLLALPAHDLAQLRQILHGMTDLERLTTRLVGGSIRSMELGSLRDGLNRCVQLARFVGARPALQVQGSLQGIFASLRLGVEPHKILDQALLEQPSTLGSGNLVFRSGFDRLLDESVALAQGGEERVAAYVEELRSQTGIQSLKVKNHKTFGLTIEVTKSNFKKVPEGFIRRQTMVNGERYTTLELKELDEVLAHAQDKAVAREAELFHDFVATMSSYHPQLHELARALGLFDLLQSFAYLAARQQYCRPKLGNDDAIVLRTCRHPVVEHFVGANRFIANDIFLSATSRQLLITGPNMAGKSTVMRQTALCAILNQAGCFVPALSAELPVFDGIFTRVGASDDLSRGMSTFMVEMTEAAGILRNATRKSLVILDEVGRGTSSADGLAIAAAILDSLANKINCWTLFATHYHELVNFAAGVASVKPMQTEVREQAGKGIIFSHRLIPGACGRSFGIEVAKLAGIPGEVVERAKDYLLTLAGGEGTGITVNASLKAEVRELFPETLEDGPGERLLEVLEKLDIENTTPLEALRILHKLKDSATGHLSVDASIKGS